MPIRSNHNKRKAAVKMTAAFRIYCRLDACLHRQVYDDLYLTEQPYGLVWALDTGLPANDWSSAFLT